MVARLALLPAVIAQQEVFDEELAYHRGALRGGVDEVSGDEARVSGVPALHGSVSAHSFKGIEKRALLLGGDVALDRDDARDGVVGDDAVDAGAFTAVHGAHDQDGNVRQRGANAADSRAEGGFVGFVDVGPKAGFIGAVIDDDQLGVVMFELFGPYAGDMAEESTEVKAPLRPSES